MRSSALPLMAVASRLLFAQSSATYSISGTVVDHRTQAPVAAVLVSVEPVASGGVVMSGGRVAASSSGRAVLTDDVGRFRIPDLPAGKYSLHAQRRGQQGHLFLEHGQFSTAIVTGPGNDSEHVVFPLLSEGRLTGAILDDDNDPVPNAAVYLLKKSVVDGKSKVFIQDQRTSNTRGAFHFAHLLPGTYYLAVSARPWYASPVATFTNTVSESGAAHLEKIPPPALVDTAFGVTYSGSTTDPDAAQPILIAEGESFTAQVTLHAVPSLHVTFQETVRSATPPSRFSGITATGPGGVPIAAPFQMNQTPISENQQETETDLSGIAPGAYRIERQVMDEKNGTAISSEVIYLGASGPLPTARDAGMRVTGHLKLDGAPRNSDITLLLHGNRHQDLAIAGPDGNFTFQHLQPPGTYRLTLLNDPQLEVEAVDSGKGVSPGNMVHVSSALGGTLGLSVTVGAHRRNSQLTGIVLDDGKPLAAAIVLAIPDNAAEDAPVGRDQSDSDGTFSIPNLAPGHYKLLAIRGSDTQLDGFEYRERAVLQPYLSHSQPVLVPLPGSVKVQATAYQSGQQQP